MLPIVLADRHTHILSDYFISISGCRILGAKAATGDVLIFLDSHCEANVNWLPPLIEPIAEDYRTVVCPFIDVLDMETFEYKCASLQLLSTPYFRILFFCEF